MESITKLTLAFSGRISDDTNAEDGSETEEADSESTTNGLTDAPLITKFTGLQASIIEERDHQFGVFVQNYEDMLEEYTSTYEKLFNDESRWEERWLKEITFLQEQANADNT